MVLPGDCGGNTNRMTGWEMKKKKEGIFSDVVLLWEDGEASATWEAGHVGLSLCGQCEGRYAPLQGDADRKRQSHRCR